MIAFVSFVNGDDNQVQTVKYAILLHAEIDNVSE